jgi:catechol 2,3-dioxygenase-like lactoylglutathione lyase family enzyme
VPPIARLRTIVLDCPDPAALAAFYRELVGGEVRSISDDWVVLQADRGWRLAFQRAEDFVPPTWPYPERPQQLHLDVTVDDIEPAEAAVLAAGARKHEVQPGVAEGDTFRVYLDPAGHPFCLCLD